MNEFSIATNGHFWPTPAMMFAQNRRQFLRTAAIAGAATIAPRPLLAALETKPQVITVLGPVAPDELGLTLTHEHALVDFIGADRASRDRYNADEVFAAVLPHLKQVKDLGCGTFVDCTPAYLGRDAALLQRLSKAAGLHILTCTGYYGALKNRFLPPHAFTDSAEQLAERWLKEWRDGIDGTGIRPGFIKIGVEGDTLSEVHRKLVQAAARAHLGSGLVIAAHTGPSKLALEELAILREEGAGAAAFIWVHAYKESDPALRLKVAESGCWLSFDKFSADQTANYVAAIKALRDQGRLNQVLLSHDAGWYQPGEPNGGKFRPYDAIFRTLLPALKEAGFSPDERDQVMAKNPAKAFSIVIRKR
jgi:phosphotriesterase-related protein